MYTKHETPLNRIWTHPFYKIGSLGKYGLMKYVTDEHFYQTIHKNCIDFLKNV